MYAFIVLVLLLSIAASAVPLDLEEYISNDQSTSPVFCTRNNLCRSAHLTQITYCPSKLVWTWGRGNSCQDPGFGQFHPTYYQKWCIFPSRLLITFAITY